MKWVKPEKVLGKTMASMIDPDEMLQDFLRVGLITEITGAYSSDVWDMCRYQMVGDQVEVVEGKFEGDSQCFVVVGDYYMDLTISMWIKDAPKFAVVHIKDAVGYFDFMRFSVPAWLKYCGIEVPEEKEVSYGFD
jgi:hypothetical protein